MNIAGLPAQTALNNPVGCHSDTASVAHNKGRTVKVVADAPKAMRTIPQESARPSVQQRSLTGVPGYMPFFRIGEQETIPAPLLEAPAFNAMSADFHRDDITVNDPEFSSSGIRPRTLATIIKTYCNSFRSRFSLNTPLIDRSDRVEKFRHRLFCALTGVLATGTTVAIVLVGIKLSVLLWSFSPVIRYAEHLIVSAFIEFLGVFSAGMLIYLCCLLMARLAFFITAAVSACLETYEKLSQSNETPQEKFMSKYQRMEKQLIHLKELYHKNFHANACPGGDCPGSINTDSCDNTISGKIEQALRRVDLWSDMIMLLFCYDGRNKDVRQALEEAILTTEQWLDNAKRQKDLLCEGVEMDELNSRQNLSHSPLNTQYLSSEKAIQPTIFQGRTKPGSSVSQLMDQV